jgi:hypothetical protein
MEKQIKNSYKVITGITLLVALLFITIFNATENIAQTQNALGSETGVKSNQLIIGVLVTGDKIEAIKKFITGWQEVSE